MPGMSDDNERLAAWVSAFVAQGDGTGLCSGDQRAELATREGVSGSRSAYIFAFLGLESATIPDGDVSDPKRTIPRSTVLGITIAGFYMCSAQ